MCPGKYLTFSCRSLKRSVKFLPCTYHISLSASSTLGEGEDGPALRSTTFALPGRTTRAGHSHSGLQVLVNQYYPGSESAGVGTHRQSWQWHFPYHHSTSSSAPIPSSRAPYSPVTRSYTHQNDTREEREHQQPYSTRVPSQPNPEKWGTRHPPRSTSLGATDEGRTYRR
jgi:hypothetical protein